MTEQPDVQYADLIEVFEGDDGWHYHGKSNNGETLFVSQPYADKDNAVKAAGDLADQARISVHVAGSE